MTKQIPFIHHFNVEKIQNSFISWKPKNKYQILIIKYSVCSMRSKNGLNCTRLHSVVIPIGKKLSHCQQRDDILNFEQSNRRVSTQQKCVKMVDVRCILCDVSLVQFLSQNYNSNDFTSMSSRLLSNYWNERTKKIIDAIVLTMHVLSVLLGIEISA